MTTTELLKKADDLLRLARTLRDGAKGLVPVSDAQASIAAHVAVGREDYARAVEPEIAAAADALERVVAFAERAANAARLRVGMDKLTPSERDILRTMNVSPADYLATKPRAP